MRKLGNCGQNLVEVAVIFALVVGVFATMQLYLQRAFQARYKAGADYVHRELAKAVPAYAGLPKHYDPYYSESLVEDSAVYSTLRGYPDSSVNDTTRRKIWMKTDIPGESD
jgi:hypothetical protein